MATDFFWRQRTDDGIYGPSSFPLLADTEQAARYIGCVPAVNLKSKLNAYTTLLLNYQTLYSPNNITQTIPTMKILVIFRLKEGVTLAQARPYLADEERVAWRNYLSGELREAYLSGQDGTVIDIFEYPSPEKLKEDMEQTLPLMRAGLLEATYYDLSPFKNWESLFETRNRTA